MNCSMKKLTKEYFLSLKLNFNNEKIHKALKYRLDKGKLSFMN